jgi:hypothetical protein
MTGGWVGFKQQDDDMMIEFVDLNENGGLKKD